jgi:hypothetical protein
MPDDDNAQPMGSAVNRSKPAAGIACPACGKPVSGRLTAAARRKFGRTRSSAHPGYVFSARARPGSIQRVRECGHCGNRCLTVERVVSNHVGGG